LLILFLIFNGLLFKINPPKQKENNNIHFLQNNILILIMEIFNEIKQKDDDKEKQKFVHRNLAEVQRCKLEKLMKNPVSFETFAEL
jgi:hypothetical protein